MAEYTNNIKNEIEKNKEFINNKINTLHTVFIILLSIFIYFCIQLVGGYNKKIPGEKNFTIAKILGILLLLITYLKIKDIANLCIKILWTSLNDNQKTIVKISLITFVINYIIAIVRPYVIESNFTKNTPLLINLTIGVIILSLIKIYYIVFNSEKQDYRTVGLFELLNSTLTLDKLNTIKEQVITI